MRIERIEVEEGFLDGLVIDFSLGLNVLIGPRGSGKTSIIELIRFCLDVERYADPTPDESHASALSILENGRVTVTLNIDDVRVRVTRSADESRPRVEGGHLPAKPIVLSQNEIEDIAVDARGRLRLLDEFTAIDVRDSQREASLGATIGSLTSQLHAIALDRRKTEDQIRTLADVPKELSDAQAAQRDAAARLSGAEELSRQLDALGQAIGTEQVKEAILRRAEEAINRWYVTFSNTISTRPQLEPWPPESGEDLLGSVRLSIADVAQHLETASNSLVTSIADLRGHQAASETHRVDLEDQARERRRALNDLEAGAGSIAKRTSELQKQASELEALERIVAMHDTQMANLREQRGVLLNELDSLRNGHHDQRVQAAGALNSQLGPTIEVAVIRRGLRLGYESAILGALRGSNLHQKPLAPLLAQVSPRELVDLVEQGDVAQLAKRANIDEARARRVVSHLEQQSLEGLLTARVDDSVLLRLLDGLEYKPTSRMSVGQRCTVVLPVLLAHREQALVIDQPEDNLDNSFIASTVIEALRTRSHSSQAILATHNANIPVLGDASRVFYLTSNGEQATLEANGPLDSPQIVRAITEVMEGGQEAFQRRAAFYKRLGG